MSSSSSSLPLKLFKIEPRKNLGRWNVYDECIVFAESQEEAILYHPNKVCKWDKVQKGWRSLYPPYDLLVQMSMSESWVAEPSLDSLKVSEIKISKKGVVLAQFCSG
jgi:hypothetical protein